MTVIYVDTLFLLNALVDYLLLLASARLAGEPLSRPRFLLGAALGGLYAAGIFLPGLGFLARPPCRLAAAAVMVPGGLLEQPAAAAADGDFFCPVLRLGAACWPSACWGAGGCPCGAGCCTRGWI